MQQMQCKPDVFAFNELDIKIRGWIQGKYIQLTQINVYQAKGEALWGG